MMRMFIRQNRGRSGTSIVVLSTALVVGFAIAARSQTTQPPPDSDFPAGVARSLGVLGETILGANKFFSVKMDPPDPVKPTLDLFIDASPHFPVHLNIFTGSQTGVRVTVENGQVMMAHDPAVSGIGNPDTLPADLSQFAPPTAVR